MTFESLTPMHHTMTVVSSDACGVRRLRPAWRYRDAE